MDHDHHPAGESWAWALDEVQRQDPHFFARRAAEAEAKRQQIVDDVARTASPGADIDYLTKRQLHRAGLISASELHATGSTQLLPRGWYQHYVEAVDQYCPARVFSLEETGTDAAHRWWLRPGWWRRLLGEPERHRGRVDPGGGWRPGGVRLVLHGQAARRR